MDKKLLYEINRFREISGLGLIKEQREEITTSIELKNYLGEEVYESVKSFLEVVIVYNDELNNSKTIKCGRTRNVGAERIKVELTLECDSSELIMITKAPTSVVTGAQVTKRKKPVKIMLSQTTVTKMESAQIKINGESPSNFQITTTVGDLLDGKKFEPITISPKDLYGPEILDKKEVIIYHDNTPIKIPNKDFGYVDKNNNTYYFARDISLDNQISISKAQSKLQNAYKEKFYGEDIPSAVKLEPVGQTINYDTKKFMDKDGNIKYLTTVISTVESLSDKGSSQNNTGEDGNNTPQDTETQVDATQGTETQGTETQGDETQGDETQGDETQGTETQGDTTQDTETQDDESGEQNNEQDKKTIILKERDRIKEEGAPDSLPDNWNDGITNRGWILTKGTHGYEPKIDNTMKAIAWLQNKLKSNGDDDLAVDGLFGDNTKQSVKEFQKKSGFDVKGQDGKVGKNTLAKLRE
jgi:hypothetical protein